jgi:hypothetical protein
MIIISFYNASITPFFKVPRCHITFEAMRKEGNHTRTPTVFWVNTGQKTIGATGLLTE